MSQLDTLVSIALDLTSAIHADERYRRLLEALHRVIPYEASALLRRQGDELIPIASCGLSPDTMGRRFALNEHPRLKIICISAEPVLFPADSPLADPVAGLLADDADQFKRVHACLGCPSCPKRERRTRGKDRVGRGRAGNELTLPRRVLIIEATAMGFAVMCR